jgi:hypothetical protein
MTSDGGYNRPSAKADGRFVFWASESNKDERTSHRLIRMIAG